ncbi:MAG: leucyl/phenylalanyl-tRNA--protein transferase [SAR324 cluster bacterium]|jgi:leucyl/phenylalanyl-tRNA---protein transferase|nr:leucyl/phenylalanyl-tRNA--protein transferase [Deltaproteobacteria bacterium]MDG1487183.1 leucyl/phenylalanyl-tRNA--protein transferase [SAR324 cluster bacterium]
MPVYQLIPEVSLFPPTEEAEDDGLLAIGGDLTKERLLAAYNRGIFPWYEVGQPILWWSPDPRLILIPEELRISRSLRKVLRKQQFEIRFDTAFQQVIKACADVRTEQGEGTWIIPEMQQAYTELHQEGFAHSVESWRDGKLAGGLYGISLGQCFFGESMFSTSNDSSKVALVALAEFSREVGIKMIDCQMSTAHLLSLGAKEIRREVFLKKLKIHLEQPTLKGSWNSGSASVKTNIFQN